MTEKRIPVPRRVVYWLGHPLFAILLFLLAMFIIFLGTFAQRHDDISSVVRTVFHSWLFWFEPGSFLYGYDSGSSFRLPMPGGFAVGLLMIVNIVAAMIRRLRYSAKYATVFAIHLGMIVLLAGEAATSLVTESGVMTVREGESSCYIEKPEHWELAVVNVSDPERHQVFAIPDNLLRKSGRRISHESLPFELIVVQWLPDSTISPADNDAVDTNPATAGAGLKYIARPSSAATTPAAGIMQPVPSIYIRVTIGDQPLDTFLLSHYFDRGESIAVGGAEGTGVSGGGVESGGGGERVGWDWRLQLRPERIYKSYTIHLLDFERQLYEGTTRPKSFISRIRLVDPGYHEDREVLIAMNRPLRYRGDTLYQYSYDQDEKGTRLLVVSNPARLVPYAATVIVSLAMPMLFLVQMAAFGRRRPDL